MAAGGGDGPVQTVHRHPARLQRTGSESRLSQAPPSGAGGGSAEPPALLTAVTNVELAALVATANRQGARGRPAAPLGHVPTVAAAMELLLQAKVTLEWDMGGAASSRASLGTGRAADAGRWMAEPPVLIGELPSHAGVLRRLGHAWTNRPSLLPGVSARRPTADVSDRLELPDPPPVIDPEQRHTTTSMADLLRLMRMAAATRPQRRLATGAAAVAGPLSRRRSGLRPSPRSQRPASTAADAGTPVTVTLPEETQVDAQVH